MIRILKATAFTLLIIILFLLGTLLFLSRFNPSFTSFTYRENWVELNTSRYSLSEHWVAREEIPTHLKWAVIASEDQRFYQHFGLDFQAIDEALEERMSGIRQRGASTITQQVAKNLFLWPNQSFFRKAIEAGIAIFVEIFWSKERILEVYLNIVEFGPGVYGVGKASDIFFGVSVSELTPQQSARLATVLPNPKRMRVEPPSPYVKERSQWVMKQMTQLSGTDYLKATRMRIMGTDSLILREMPRFNLSYSDSDSVKNKMLKIDSSNFKNDSTFLENKPDSLPGYEIHIDR